MVSRKKLARLMPILGPVIRQRDAALRRLADLETRPIACPSMLPGTNYSRYAMPLEYPPSRALRPRWGNTHPVIEPLADWLGSFDNEYHTLLAEMRAFCPVPFQDSA
jgi:hypothetical protein